MEGTIQPYGDNFAFVIPVDEILHTPDNPFCPIDPHCPCHEDQALIAAVAQFVSDGLMTPDEATRFVEGRTI
jgi:hypothetical protein